MPSAVSAPALRLFAVLALLVGFPFGCMPAVAQLYRDPSAAIDKRVNDLVGRMTLEEKVRQM